ncbi:hypothetical protein N7466_004581 [Penicillium verhagenii]|uniref:uncharacterized protein n=1 Tax=Penicillium verhagenii TaxID=1562060 RepID=UPI002544E5BE|nr:uncharacterized protein N7466_004581 [Penicillium verhagenii]KAJ5935034.1 hypothetical protein N7466_004581 [Penicillium verhagenii]
MTDFTEANRKYFDQLAVSYQDRFADSMKMLSEQTLQNRLWISDQWKDTVSQDQDIRMLEYACGPGMISMTLAPFLTQVIGIDVSDNMVEQFNHNSGLLGLTDKVIGHTADLLAENIPVEFSGPPYKDLDLVTISMALHHFENPANALQQLGGRLKKGGVCYIIDLVSHSGHGHGNGGDKHDFGNAAHTVKSHGFSQENMQELFQGAGFGAVGYKILDQPLVFSRDGKNISKTVFIARAQRV